MAVCFARFAGWLVGWYARTMNSNIPISRSFSSYSLQGFLFFTFSKYFKAFKAVLLVLSVLYKKNFAYEETDRQRETINTFNIPQQFYVQHSTCFYKRIKQNYNTTTNSTFFPLFFFLPSFNFFSFHLIV